MYRIYDFKYLIIIILLKSLTSTSLCHSIHKIFLFPYKSELTFETGLHWSNEVKNTEKLLKKLCWGDSEKKYWGKKVPIHHFHMISHLALQTCTNKLYNRYIVISLYACSIYFLHFVT